ncbi:MAG: low molecular weight phosphatase family protein [Bernardetiaceae bacterium]|jgi:protein-tyrosine phosphatase|nr:low molecular weight phosphatase family protein [Bernardetiaceae bacterium]
MQNILFLCTGNYYRSRFAEAYFNHLAQEHQLPWRAVSRGLHVKPGHNPGPIAPAALAYLRHLGVTLPGVVPYPQPVTEADFAASAQWVALDETEHRPMLRQWHPAQEPATEGWHFADVQFVSAAQLLPQLADHLRQWASSPRFASGSR